MKLLKSLARRYYNTKASSVWVRLARSFGSPFTYCNNGKRNESSVYISEFSVPFSSVMKSVITNVVITHTSFFIMSELLHFQASTATTSLPLDTVLFICISSIADGVQLFRRHCCRIQTTLKDISRGLRGVMRPWFDFWFGRYIYCFCLFISYASPLMLISSRFSYLSPPLLIFSFQNRPAPFPGWMS